VAGFFVFGIYSVIGTASGLISGGFFISEIFGGVKKSAILVLSK
jgi:hypothetical protein